MYESFMNEKITLLGVPLSTINLNGLLKAIESGVKSDSKILILSGNVYAYNLAYNNQWLHGLYNQADFVRLDGEGVRWGARILGYCVPPRMTWADFAWQLANFAEENQYSLYLLGGKPGVANIAAERLLERHPNLIIAGIHHGYFDKTQGSEENEDVIQHLNQSRPNILIIGFGMPVQEQWVLENHQKINVNVIMTGGAVFDYISGELRRAPSWMTENGLEWLGRLIIEPRRLWKRYLVGNPIFLWRILLQRFGILRYD
jgi:N-acetylglucosaminyldiphosphoundecaprenol N-acetyl-beta-D-mannosaminyltransferase